MRVYASCSLISETSCAGMCFFFFQAEDGIRDLVRSRGLGDVYKRQDATRCDAARQPSDFDGKFG